MGTEYGPGSLPAMRRALASSFGLGLIPRALWGSDAGAGTFGAALGAGIGAALLGAAPWVGALVAAGVTLVALWAAAPFAQGDPGWVSIDETAGTLVALIGLGGWPWIAALAVARLGDIFKVLPGVRRSEGLPGAVGIVGDDVVAGIYGLGAGWLLTAAGL